jgi:peptide deformylase
MKKRKARVMPITQLGTPVLRKKLKEVKDFRTPPFQQLIDDMIATMRKAQGVGIAANQVGVDERVFIVAPEPSVRYPKSPAMPPLAMINPKLLKHSKERETDWEGCLSIPGLRGRVPRYSKIIIEFTTRDGDVLRAQLSGFVARIFQHEFDHINGLCYLDRVEDTKTFITEAEYRRMMSPAKKSRRTHGRK